MRRDSNWPFIGCVNKNYKKEKIVHEIKIAIFSSKIKIVSNVRNNYDSKTATNDINSISNIGQSNENEIVYDA